MKKNITITESDLKRIVRRVIKEEDTDDELEDTKQEEMYRKLGELIYNSKKLVDMGFDHNKLVSVLKSSLTRYVSDNPYLD